VLSPEQVCRRSSSTVNARMQSALDLEADLLRKHLKAALRLARSVPANATQDLTIGLSVHFS
jgi:hypothetical protein